MTDLDLFIQEVQAQADQELLVGLQLYKPRQKGQPTASIKAKLVQLKKGLHVQLAMKQGNNPVFENIPIAQLSTWLRNAMEQFFFEAQMQSTTSDVHYLSNKKGSTHMKKSRAQHAAPVLKHNREKQHIIKAKAAPYLQKLGIANSDGSIKDKMQAKFRQMNRYIEYVDALLQNVALDELQTVVDMGSGKGYLSFALYAHLLEQNYEKPIFVGVERRAELVDLCNSVAEDLNYDQLMFTATDIADANIPDMDMMIALHACDTATDDALLQALKSSAKLIVASPCCHKQLRTQLESTEDLSSILMHGIYQERFAEMLTDSTRVELLKLFGYQAKIVEFIASEHTAKNTLILASRKQVKLPTNGDLIDLKKQLKNYGINKMKLLDEVLSNPNLQVVDAE